MTASETITYYLRGIIERGTGRGYEWREGYSAQGEMGGVLYPWNTKRECQKAAKAQGKKAVFVTETDLSSPDYKIQGKEW